MNGETIHPAIGASDAVRYAVSLQNHRGGEAFKPRASSCQSDRFRAAELVAPLYDA